MVQTVFSATVYVNKVVVNDRNFQRLVDSVKKLDPQKNILTAEEKLDIVVRAINRNPFRFFNGTSEYYRQKHRITSSGTGFFVSGDGYLVTNAHIIDRDSAFVRKKFIQSTFRDVTNANIKSLENSWNMVLTDEQKLLIENAYGAIYFQVSSMVIFNLERDIQVQFKSNKEGQANGNSMIKLPARIVVKGGAIPAKDIAILKVDSVEQMPTLQLSRDSVPKIGEQVFVYGYPEPATSNVFLTKEAGIEPTLTAGIVSAIKLSIGGWPVVQMDAAIAHGSSGSPVCNSRGRVVGIATFGSLEQQTGNLAGGYNFAIPISLIKQYLDSAKVKPAMSMATTTFNEGLHFFFERYYNRAISKFDAVKKLNADYPHLNYYIRMSNKRIESGEDRGFFEQHTIYRIIAIAIILGGGLMFYLWKRKKNKND